MKSKKLRLIVLAPVMAGLAAACSGGGINISAEGPAIPNFPSGSPGTVQFMETSFDATEGTIVNIIVARSGGSAGASSSGGGVQRPMCMFSW